jgi:hypothetical protein
MGDRRRKEDDLIKELTVKDPNFDIKLRFLLNTMMGKIRLQEDPDDFHEDVRGMLSSESGNPKHAVSVATAIHQLPRSIQKIANGEMPQFGDH